MSDEVAKAYREIGKIATTYAEALNRRMAALASALRPDRPAPSDGADAQG